MSSVFSFRCWTKATQQAMATLIVFVPPDSLSENSLRDAISRETLNSLSPECVFILCSEKDGTAASLMLKECPDIFLPLAHYTAVVVCTFDKKGEIRSCAGIGDWEGRNFPSNEAKRQGLSILMQRREGLLDAGSSAHFVKPSGNFDRFFLKASNSLSEGSEIFFIALWILPHLDDDIRQVNLDTSGISSVIMAALLMKEARTIPSITSFRSYDGLDSHHFAMDRSELTVISASQSGRMSKLLQSRVANRQKIITIFTTSPNDTVGACICDISYDKLENPFGLKRQNRNELLGSRPIQVIGEHFATDFGATRAVMPSLNHSPTVVKKTLQHLQGQKVFWINRVGPNRSEAKSIWVETDNLRCCGVYTSWVAGLAAKHFPAATKAIIHPDASEAQALKDDLIAGLRAQGVDTSGLKTLGYRELEEVSAKAIEYDSEVAIVIAGGATGHGEDLLAVSRALRSWAPKSHRLFLSSATVPSTARGYELLHSNLVQPSHKFESLFHLAVNRIDVAESWRLELNLLRDDDDSLPASLNARLDELTSAKGLQNNLFLSNSTSNLKLRKNFAFWPSITNCDNASQADVFVTIAAILENMRSGTGFDENARLLNNATQHSILSSSTFSRFNDGVIQAAFLRGASAIELNYRNAPADSRMLSRLISEMCDMVDQPQAEALTEFLCALTTGRLKFANNDTELLKDKLRRSMDSLDPAQTWFAGKYIT